MAIFKYKNKNHSEFKFIVEADNKWVSRRRLKSILKESGMIVNNKDWKLIKS